MNKDVPVSNKYLSSLWRSQVQYQHMMNILNMKSTLNFTALKPKRYLTKNRSKKTLLEKGITTIIIERSMEIERQNKMLLEKMSSIVHGSCTPYLKKGI